MITTNSAPFLRDIRLNGLLNRGLSRLEGTRGEKRGFSQRLVTPARNPPANHRGVAGKVLAGIFRGRFISALFAFHRRERWLKWHWDRGYVIVPMYDSFDDHYLSNISRLLVAGIFLGLLIFSVPFEARADEAAAKVKAPEFVPIVVDQNQYQAILQYLNGLKFGDAAPVVRWLNELEDRARGQWEADHAAKKEEGK